MNQGHEYSTPGLWGRLSGHLRSLTLSTVLLRPFLFIMAYDIFVYHPISRSDLGAMILSGTEVGSLVAPGTGNTHWVAGLFCRLPLH